MIMSDAAGEPRDDGAEARAASDRAPVDAALAWAILLLALGLGVAADLLLRLGWDGENVALSTLALLLGGRASPSFSSAAPVGLNGALWCVALLAGCGGLLWWRRARFSGVSGWLLVTAGGFALALAWRDSPLLKALDTLAILASLALVALRAPTARLRLASLSDYALAALSAGLNASTRGAALLFRDLPRSHAADSGPWRRARAIGGGLALAAPLLLIFGGLFAAADRHFAELVSVPLPENIDVLVAHIVITLGTAWLVAGYLRGLAHADAAPLPAGLRRRFIAIGAVEISTALALVNLLFLLFVVLQFRYLFGGAARVEASASLTYAEYARRGFFELVTVSALVLGLLLLAHWSLRVERRRDETVFRVLAATLIALLAVVMLSALQRMSLYTREYGLTELRLYTTAFMLWLAALIGWFGVTVLRGRRDRFAFGALIAGFLAVALLHLLNPDATIARVNSDRAANGQRADADYLTRLSDDAVPALAAGLPSAPPAQRCVIAAELLRRWPAIDQADWRVWSLAREQARRAIAARLDDLRAARCDGP